MLLGLLEAGDEPGAEILAAWGVKPAVELDHRTLEDLKSGYDK